MCCGDESEVCVLCGASVGEYGDFVEWQDGSIVCDECNADCEVEQMEAFLDEGGDPDELFR